MDKRKQTLSDQRGEREKRRPRDPGPDREPSWRPSDALYSKESTPIDRDLDLRPLHHRRRG